MSALLKSLRTLAGLLFTSSAFRLILSDLLITTRELVADIAENVEQAAETVEAVAQNVEELVRPEGVTLEEHTTKSRVGPQEDQKMTPKEVVLNRLEQVAHGPTINNSFDLFLFAI